MYVRWNPKGIVSCLGYERYRASVSRVAGSREILKKRCTRDRYVLGWKRERTKKRGFEPCLKASSLPWTMDQIAGMFVGIGLIALAMTANRADEMVAKSQRLGLGICIECGGIGCESCSKRGMESILEEDVGDEEDA